MLLNALRLALREIRRNVMRSFLTVLGIVIGVAAVITMVTIGEGATAKVKSDITKLGSNLLMVRPGQRRGPGGSSGEATPFKIEDVKAIVREVGSLAATAPSGTQSGTAVYGNKNWSTRVTGTDNDFLIVRDWDVTLGRSFLESELRSGKPVCILGETVRKELFGSQDPIGQRVRLKKVTCQVIGVLGVKGQTGMGTDQDDTVIVPLRTFQRRFTGSPDIAMIQVSVEDGASTQKAREDIERLLRERRRIGPTANDDFTVTDMTEISEALAGTTKVMTSLLGAVAAVSLLVGGIGIMNIMLVSVTERTREIGTRLAIGALARDVLLQFLVEAVVLSSFGGIMGITLALTASLALSKPLQVPFVFNPGIVIVAFLFSSAVGVVFGFFPARRAARLDPIEALRHE